MKHYPIYKQEKSSEVERMVQSMSMCLFTTINAEKRETGVFNPVYQDGVFYLHLNKSDEQFKSLLKFPKAELIFFDFLCNIPSYWVDAFNGGVATSFYRYAEFKCKVETYTEVEDVAATVGRFLEKYQSEGGYAPIDSKSATYQKSLNMLGIVELRPVEVISKWKLGQNRPVEKRIELIKRLRLRNHGNDFRAAEEIERWLELNS
jgi:predicted FMN-binding regulatory protein PaiB